MMARRGEKEDAVYEAVFRLLSRGEQMHTVTVQQIAQEAGIGKGTVYEYFTSREEILAKAFLRRVTQETQALAARVDAAQSFDEKLENLLGFAWEAMQAQLSCIKVLLADTRAAGLVEQLCGNLRGPGGGGGQIAQQLCDLIGRIVEYGVREGALPAPPGETYALMAVSGGVFGYANACRMLPAQSEKALRAEAKRMIYRALGAEHHRQSTP